MDAMGYQIKIARAIIQQSGGYPLAVKGSQRNLTLAVNQARS